MYPSVLPRQPLKFTNGNAFQLELRRRVEEYFRTTGHRPRDCWQMYVKTAILLTGFTILYALLVFVAQTWWQGLLLAVLLGLSAAGIGFNIQHDGGHHAYSNHPWVNKLMAMTLELIGGSSYLWRWKHVVLHHTYVNITGHDTDIDLGLLARLIPHQRRLPYHRWQHLYLWPLYGLLAIKWQLVDDFRKLINGRISNQPFPRPKGWELGIFIAGKVIFFSVAFGIPLLFHSIGVALLYYGVAGLVTGLALSVVFQVAHCVEEAEFPLPLEDAERIEQAWAIHQVETTVDFARGSSRCVAHRWPELSDRAPPVPPALSRQLSGDLETRGRDLSRVRDQVHGAQVVSGRYGVPLPVAAPDGDADHSHMTLSEPRGLLRPQNPLTAQEAPQGSEHASCSNPDVR